MQNRRVCKWCGVGFELTKGQRRQAKKKWPIHCSRSCSKKTQHAKNHRDKRKEKVCEQCESTFIITIYDKAKRFCSTKCFSRFRFGEPKPRIDKQKRKINQILKDEKYQRFLNNIFKKIAFKYGVEKDDLVQDYFVGLLSGHGHSAEQSSMQTIRLEYNRGITGKWRAKECLSQADFNELQKFKFNHNSEIDRIDYLMDIKNILSEKEFGIACLFMMGLNCQEIIETGVPRRQVYRFSKKTHVTRFETEMVK